MAAFSVNFYKTLQIEGGHRSKHLQRRFVLTSDSPSGALVAAEQMFDQRALEFDCVEVVGISSASCDDADAASDGSRDIE
jgi:hypothetical protein